MSQSLLQQLSTIDTAWQKCHPLGLQQIMNYFPEKEIDLEVLAELLAADSEWRWRIKGFNSDAPAGAGCAWQDLRPRRVETYLAEIPELGDSPEAVRMLIESEFMARSRWGDPPLISEFLARFPYVEGLEQLLRESLDELSMVYVRRSEVGSEGSFASPSDPAYFPVNTPLSIGRQSAKEPRDTFLMPGRRRLIVVDNYQHGVSRLHCLVSRQSLDRCLIANISPLGEMKLNRQEFPPGSRQTVIFPFVIEIGGVCLEFRQR